jgi:1,4-dihydroxy-2-naphthoate octaprenyltransferase
LGDLFVMIFFGFAAVAGTVFVQSGYVPVVSWFTAVPVGALATAILVVNNLRDIETDRKAGKRTLAVRFGAKAAVAEYIGLLAVAYLTPIALTAAQMTSAFGLLPLATAPQAVMLSKQVISQRGRPLNATLGGTAKLLLWFGLLFAGGIAASHS